MLSHFVEKSSKLAILDISMNLIPLSILSDKFTRAVNRNISLAKLYMTNMKNMKRSGCLCCVTEAEFPINFGDGLTVKIKHNHSKMRKVDILSSRLMEGINNDVIETWESVYRHVESTVSQDFFTCFRKCA